MKGGSTIGRVSRLLGLSDGGRPADIRWVPVEFPEGLKSVIVDIAALCFVDRIEAANVDWQSLPDVNVGKARTVQNSGCKDNKGGHFGIGSDPLAEVDRVAVVEWIVATLDLSDVPEGKRPAEIIGLHADAQLWLAELPMGVVGQANAIADASEKPGFGNIVIDNYSHAGQAGMCGFDREEPRLNPSA